MAAFGFRLRPCFRVLLGLIVVLLIVVFVVEIFYTPSDSDTTYEVVVDRLNGFDSSQEGEEAMQFDFADIDENWVESFSEDGTFYDEVDHAVRNIKKPAAYAAKYKLPIVIWWTSFAHGNNILRCNLGECYFTEVRKFQTHPRTKAFMFYGTSFSGNDLPLPRLGHHEWALFHEESPKNNPILHHQTTIQLFNHTATFRRTSDYPLVTQMLSSLDDLLKKPKYNVAEKSSDDIASVVYVQSGCDPPSDRDVYVSELMKFIRIDSYGSCLHNKDLPEKFKNPLTMNDQGFHNIIARYKFTLSFENGLCQDYITEKLWRPLVLGSVPIYKGSPSVQDWMPNNHSIILVDDFDSPKDLADFIRRLDQNDEEYAKYLEFKDKGVTNHRLTDFMKNRPWGHTLEEQNYVTGFECFVCDRIHENRKRDSQQLPQKEYIASQAHYGCPRPVKYNFPHHSASDEGDRDLWWQEYDQTVRESKELNELVKSNWYL